MRPTEKAMALCKQYNINDTKEISVFTTGYLDGYIDAMKENIAQMKTAFPDREQR